MRNAWLVVVWAVVVTVVSFVSQSAIANEPVKVIEITDGVYRLDFGNQNRLDEAIRSFCEDHRDRIVMAVLPIPDPHTYTTIWQGLVIFTQPAPPIGRSTQPAPQLDRSDVSIPEDSEDPAKVFSSINAVVPELEGVPLEPTLSPLRSLAPSFGYSYQKVLDPATGDSVMVRSPRQRADPPPPPPL